MVKISISVAGNELFVQDYSWITMMETSKSAEEEQAAEDTDNPHKDVPIPSKSIFQIIQEALNKTGEEIVLLSKATGEKIKEISAQVSKETIKLDENVKPLFKQVGEDIDNDAIVITEARQDLSTSTRELAENVSKQTKVVAEVVGRESDAMSISSRELAANLGAKSQKLAKNVSEQTKAVAKTVEQGSVKIAANVGNATKAITDTVARETVRVASNVGNTTRAVADTVERGSFVVATKIGSIPKAITEAVESESVKGARRIDWVIETSKSEIDRITVKTDEKLSEIANAIVGNLSGDGSKAEDDGTLLSGDSDSATCGSASIMSGSIVSAPVHTGSAAHNDDLTLSASIYNDDILTLGTYSTLNEGRDGAYNDEREETEGGREVLMSIREEPSCSFNEETESSTMSVGNFFHGSFLGIPFGAEASSMKYSNDKAVNYGAGVNEGELMAAVNKGELMAAMTEGEPSNQLRKMVTKGVKGAPTKDLRNKSKPAYRGAGTKGQLMASKRRNARRSRTRVPASYE